MAKIITYTGIMLDPMDIHLEDLEIKDIAHALSYICRGNGQVHKFFTVGKHCINCAKEALARGYSNRVAMALLVHDASECYLSDVPRPFKVMLPEYNMLEEKTLDVIYTRFVGSSLTDEEKILVKKIDDDMLWFDLRDLLKCPSSDPEPEMASVFNFDSDDFLKVENDYLELYNRLKDVL